eukprot:2056960-Rhodomonas_salina.3
MGLRLQASLPSTTLRNRYVESGTDIVSFAPRRRSYCAEPGSLSAYARARPHPGTGMRVTAPAERD